MSARDIAYALGAAQREGRNWRCNCPLHGGHSLTLADGRSRTLLVKCFGNGGNCDSNEILAELRRRKLLPQPEPRRNLLNIVATYDYRDADGALLFQVCRLDPKTFRQGQPNGTWNIKNISRVLYRLPELVAGRAATDGQPPRSTSAKAKRTSTGCATNGAYWRRVIPGAPVNGVASSINI